MKTKSKDKNVYNFDYEEHYYRRKVRKGINICSTSWKIIDKNRKI